MSQNTFTTRPEQKSDATAVEKITAQIFGPGMKARAAYALREGVPHEMDLSFVAEHDGKLVGSVRLTRITIGETAVLMLGPLGVLRTNGNVGIGRQLMRDAVDAARARAEQGGDKAIMLVGDLAYYQPFGFQRVPHGSITLPRPVDHNRVLVCELIEGAAENLKGAAHRVEMA